MPDNPDMAGSQAGSCEVATHNYVYVSNPKLCTVSAHCNVLGDVCAALFGKCGPSDPSDAFSAAVCPQVQEESACLAGTGGGRDVQQFQQVHASDGAQCTWQHDDDEVAACVRANSIAPVPSGAVGKATSLSALQTQCCGKTLDPLCSNAIKGYGCFWDGTSGQHVGPSTSGVCRATNLLSTDSTCISHTSNTACGADATCKWIPDDVSTPDVITAGCTTLTHKAKRGW
jgi:hypothetical protein